MSPHAQVAAAERVFQAAVHALDSGAPIKLPVLRQRAPGLPLSPTPRPASPACAPASGVFSNSRRVSEFRTALPDLGSVAHAVHQVMEVDHPMRRHRSQRYGHLAIKCRRRDQNATGADAAIGGVDVHLANNGDYMQ